MFPPQKEEGIKRGLIVFLRMTYKKRHNHPISKTNQKTLRKKRIPVEAFLRKQLSGKKFYERKFKRQHSIDPHIVDFYCASEKQVIELDREVYTNATAEHYDTKRTIHLQNEGLTLLRFENKMVFENLSAVLEEIEDNFK